MRIEILRTVTEDMLKSLTKYQSTMESQLSTVQKEEQQRISDLAKTFGMDEQEMLAEGAYEEYQWTYDFMFPLSFRYSFIVLLFLVLESQLVSLCDEVKRRKGVPLRANELKGDAISRFKIFLKKLAGVAIDEKFWEKIEDLSKVRHCVVHTLGDVKKSSDEKHLRALATRRTDTSISSNDLHDKDILNIEPEYCAQAVEDVKNLFEEIFNAAGFGSSFNKL